MKEIILATYTRESTLWKNANMFYKAQDWVKMQCIFIDRSDDRNDPDIRLLDKNGKDITDYICRDRYRIVLSTIRHNSRAWDFDTRDEANAFFKEIMANKILSNFRKVK